MKTMDCRHKRVHARVDVRCPVIVSIGLSAPASSYVHHANVGCGTAARRSRVYCACGEPRICAVGPCSTMRPAHMTMTRSHKSRTTLRSWETNR